MTRISRQVTIVIQKGLHARASAKFVTFVSRLPEGLKVEVEKESEPFCDTGQFIQES
jgi:phosphocarrier protein